MKSVFGKFGMILVGMMIALLAAHSASALSLEVKELNIPDAEYDQGDIIKITANFEMKEGDPGKQYDMRIETYIDGQLVSSDVETEYKIGSNSYAFKYDTAGREAGAHKVRMRFKLYDNDSAVADIEEEADSFRIAGEVKASTATQEKKKMAHKLIVDKVESDSKAKVGGPVDVNVYVENAGDYEENGIRVSAEMGDNREETSEFSLSPGKTAVKTLQLEAPEVTGPYDVTVRAWNKRVSDEESRQVTVIDDQFSLMIDPENAVAGELVHVYGFLNDASQSSQNKAMLYKGYNFVGTADVEPNGYYSGYVSFSETGLMLVQVKIGDQKKGAWIKVMEKEDEVEAEAAGTSAKQDKGPVTVIVVEEGSEKVYPAGGAMAENASAEKSSAYVDVEASAKEVDVASGSSSMVAVTVRNRLGRAEVFKVKTDYPEGWAFVPMAETVGDGEDKTMYVYISPKADQGRYNGNIIVFMGDSEQEVKTLPVSVFVAKSAEELQKGEGMLGTTGFVLFQSRGTAMLAGLVFLVIVVLLTSVEFDGGKEASEALDIGSVKRPLLSPEPLRWSWASRMAERTRRAYSGRQISSPEDSRAYFVPDEKVIY